ncbi:MAG: hypothetical protein AB7O24_12875 [Kofleriaceae bacterium]
MRRGPLAVVMVALAACYQPEPPAACSIKCAGDGPCPAGLSCVDGICSSEPGECADEDFDLVINADDNCPGTPNPAIDGTQRDDDGDDVGDACDPHPSSPHDAIAAREFFNATSFSDWLPDDPTAWTIEDGAAITPPETPQVFSRLTLAAAPLQRPTVEAGITIDAVGPEGRNNHVGVLLSVPSGATCYIEEDAPGSNSDLTLEIDSSVVGTEGLTAITSGSPLVFRFTRDTDQFRCALDHVPGPLEIVDAQPAPTEATAVPSIFVESIKARIRYVVVYEYVPAS